MVGAGQAHDRAYYENPSLWAAERYLGDEAERRRLHACAAAVPPGARSLLDVGAGNGAFLRVLEEARPELRLAGVERAHAAVELAVCRFPLRMGSIDRIPAEDRSFDVVSSLEVIEHLPRGVYEAGLRELERVARTTLLIEVPYREGRVQVRCPYCGCEFNPHYHVRQFDDRAMRTLFTGFRCVRLEKITYRDVLLGPVVKRAYRAVRRRLGFFPPSCVCPQCGFRGSALEEGAAGSVDPAVRERTALALRVGRLGRRLLPARERAIAVIGVYERIGR